MTADCFGLFLVVGIFVFLGGVGCDGVVVVFLFVFLGREGVCFVF